MGRHARLAGIVLAMTSGLSVGCGGGGGGPDGQPAPPAAPIFVHEGLDGRIVGRLHRHGNRLFAATDDGLFGKFVGQNNWVGLGLGGFNVRDVAIIDDQRWLAAAFTAGNLEDSLLFETVNGGSNWLEVATDFGSGTQPEPMFALLYDGVSQNLFAVGTNALAGSADFGRTWELLDGSWDTLSTLSALSLNPLTRQVWVGGQNGIEEMVLRRYDLATGASSAFTRLLPSPAVIKGITFDPGDPNRVLASGEGGVLQSLNNGQTWANLLGDVDHRFYFQAALDPQNPNAIYTAGWDKLFDEPQPLILEISRNRGSTWVAHQLNDPALFGGAWSLLAVTENDRTVLYVGLYRGGIVKVLLPDV